MTVTVKSSEPLTVPEQVRRSAGLKHGDEVEFRVSGGVINIVPKVGSVEDEYTPEQRRAIDAKLDEAEKGPFHGPFKTADEAIAHMKSALKKRTSVRKSKRGR